MIKYGRTDPTQRVGERWGEHKRGFLALVAEFRLEVTQKVTKVDVEELPILCSMERSYVSATATTSGRVGNAPWSS